jgi:hypothetical protein
MDGHMAQQSIMLVSWFQEIMLRRRSLEVLAYAM